MARLLIAASGTGGHLYPALAVAEALPTWQVHWLGVPDRLERQLVPDIYPLHLVQAGGLQGSGPRRLLNLLRLLGAVVPTCRLIRHHRIQAVFSTGGYIAAPAILAARSCGIPVVLHDANAIPGRVTRLLGRHCSRVALGLAVARRQLPRARVLTSGTPVRKGFRQPMALPPWVPHGPGPLLLVIGGSQGAVGMNAMVRAVLPPLLDAGCRVVHLTGHNDGAVASPRHPAYVSLPFSEEIPALLQGAALAVSRAGAGSLSELAVCGCPAVLIPYPFASDDHQRANAEVVAERAAAVIVEEGRSDQTRANLQRTLWRLLGPGLRGVEGDLDPLQPMARAMAAMATETADRTLARLLQTLVD